MKNHFETDNQLSESDEREMSAALRDVAVQIMRYSRGSGDLYRLRQALADASEAVNATGQLPARSLESSFGVVQSWRNDDYDAVENWKLMENHAIDRICSSALQIVATKISGSTQGNTLDSGRSELRSGIELYNEARDEMRKASR